MQALRRSKARARFRKLAAAQTEWLNSGGSARFASEAAARSLSETGD
jgi:hypothetical protein